MPQTPLFLLKFFMFEIFIYWDPSLHLLEYIFYFLWNMYLEAKSTKTNESKVVANFVKSNILQRLGHQKPSLAMVDYNSTIRPFGLY